MTIDWLELLRQHHVEYVESGRNVSRGFVATHCPFCGPSDESQHLSINLRHGGWRCWRNPQHRGGDPVRLLAALTGSSPGQARAWLGPDLVVMPDDLRTTVQAKLYPDEPEPPPALEMPEEFRPLKEEPAARRFLNYLHGRDFLMPHKFGKRYGLHYASYGDWRDRIVFPIYDYGKLVAWTARSIRADVGLRYKTEGPIGDHLLWFDELQDDPASTILLCEGPFDALKVRAAGASIGVTATCWFTSTPNRRQVDRLYELLPRFRQSLLVLDRDARSRALPLASSLVALGVRRVALPAGYDDPGELDKMALAGLVEAAKMR